jgi:hypothetical protein
MRTKTLLLTAVLGVAGVAATTAQAQSVYSLNAVGYVNLSLGAGFTIIANPLNATTNNLNTILTNGMALGTVVYKFNAGTQLYAQSTFAGGKFNPDQTLNPGEAAFIKLAAATTVTFVGNVPQGSLSQSIPVGFSLQSAPIPVSVSLTNSVLAFPGNTSDIAYNFVNATQLYANHTFVSGKFNPDYAPAVGEGFFYLNKATTARTWNVTFSVN